MVHTHENMDITNGMSIKMTESKSKRWDVKFGGVGKWEVDFKEFGGRKEGGK